MTGIFRRTGSAIGVGVGAGAVGIGWTVGCAVGAGVPVARATAVGVETGVAVGSGGVAVGATVGVAAATVGVGRAAARCVPHPAIAIAAKKRRPSRRGAAGATSRRVGGAFGIMALSDPRR